MLHPPSNAAAFLGALFFLSLGAQLPAVLDENTNQQSDLWEMLHNAHGLAATADADHDGWTNQEEAEAGTDPLDGASFPLLRHQSLPGNVPVVEWEALLGKTYQLWMKGDLADPDWEIFGPLLLGEGGVLEVPSEEGTFYQITIGDTDSDEDGLTDWEELMLGWNPNNPHTERRSDEDYERLQDGLASPSVLSVAVYDDECWERWPDPAVLVLRRTGGGLGPLTVNVAIGGSADRDVDYTLPIAGNTVTFAPGQTEFFLEVVPIPDDDDSEPAETVTMEILAGTGYTLAPAPAVTSASANIINQTDTSGPSPEEAARFLIQAAFGPDQDSADDPDQIPENVEEVMAIGFEAWIDDQFERPIGKLTPYVEWAQAQPGSAQIYNDRKQNAWWGRAMGLRKPRPDSPEEDEQDPDPLRQRVGFALSQIFVISDRMEDLAVAPLGVVDYYDMLLENSFGNYRELLEDVTLHPCMGTYLSHLANQKSNGTLFPDENYAREVMQLFSIGLWMLNPDGTRQLDDNDQPIPTYDNTTITNFARVFTGLCFDNRLSPGGPRFELYPKVFVKPMIGWDQYHDLEPKTLLLGVVTPARTASPNQDGLATMADVGAAMDNLHNHPNVGPFLARLLIQRFVTSNPSPEYIGRVAAAFADNGDGERGDLKAVIKAILLDHEARSPDMLADPAHGKLRDPFLKVVNMARAFNAASEEGWYYLDAFALDHVQEPMKSPSVFNFFLPSYSPPGALAQSGLVAPEFQLINATSLAKAPNYFWNNSTAGLHRWGTAYPGRAVTLNLDQERTMNAPNHTPGNSTPAYDPDPLIRRLDLALTGGTLTPRSFQIIREAVNRVGPGSSWTWPNDRLRLAIYLITTSPEMSVLR